MNRLYKILAVGIWVLVALAMPAYADETSQAADIFDKLADRAGVIGGGLRNSGYLIAGFGLIVFSFMAIFNKISWKNFAYIAFSCFLLSVMAAVINYISSGGTQAPTLSFEDHNGGAEISGSTKDVVVIKTPK